jgi:raffinose synthase
VSTYNDFPLPLYFESYVLKCISSLLKIWNLNKCSGVVGVFNCQGAGWCKIEKKNRIHCETPGTLSGSVCTSDVDLIAQVAGADWNGDAVVYAYRAGNFIGHKISEFRGVE